MRAVSGHFGPLTTIVVKSHDPYFLVSEGGFLDRRTFGG